MNAIIDNLVVGGAVGFASAIMIYAYQRTKSKWNNTLLAIFSAIACMFLVVFILLLIEDIIKNKPPSKAELRESATKSLSKKIYNPFDDAKNTKGNGKFCGRDSIDAWTRTHPDRRTDCEWDKAGNRCVFKYSLPDKKILTIPYDYSYIYLRNLGTTLANRYPGKYFKNELDIECLKGLGAIEDSSGFISFPSSN